MTLRRWLSTSTALGIAAVLSRLLCALALKDISHGEADVRTEWLIVQIDLVVTAAFIVVALVTLSKASRAV